MRNENIGKVLKSYRKNCCLSVRDVVSILNDNYHLQVADKTIYGWESNQAHPTTDMFLVLCEIYQITNLAESFALNNNNSREFPITLEERALIQSYRKHPQCHEAIRQLLGL